MNVVCRISAERFLVPGAGVTLDTRGAGGENAAMTMMDEAVYRRKVQETLDRIQAAFEEVDPDVAECEQQFGALTIKLAGGSRCILSAQPSVRQIWLAVAARGVAYHFNYQVNSDAETGRWLDDKGKGIELTAYLRDFLRESVGLELAIGG